MTVPVASPITRDLAIDGGGLVAVGVAGVVAASVLVGGGPARAIVPFIIVSLVFGFAQVVVSGGWLRNAVTHAPPAPSGLVDEPRDVTIRRAGLPTLVALVLVALALYAWVQFAALLAGVAFAAGAADLRSRSWIARFEAHDDVTVLRESAALPFATARKPLWRRARGAA